MRTTSSETTKKFRQNCSFIWYEQILDINRQQMTKKHEELAKKSHSTKIGRFLSCEQIQKKNSHEWEEAKNANILFFQFRTSSIFAVNDYVFWTRVFCIFGKLRIQGAQSNSHVFFLSIFSVRPTLSFVSCFFVLFFDGLR